MSAADMGSGEGGDELVTGVAGQSIRSSFWGGSPWYRPSHLSETLHEAWAGVMVTMMMSPSQNGSSVVGCWGVSLAVV